MNKTCIAVTALLAASIAPGLAGAQGFGTGPESGWYAGADVGQSKARDFCEGSPIGCDDTDTGWKIFGGYQFNRNFGAEVGYADFGKFSAAGTVSGTTIFADAKATAWELVGVGTIPLGANFSAYGKAGFFRWDADLSASGSAPGFTPVAIGGSDTGTDFTYGLGIKYDFTRNIGARLQWQRYNNVGDTDFSSGTDIDLYIIGVMWKF